MTMINNRFSIIAIPTVQLYTTTTFLQSIDISIHTGRTTELILQKISVVGRGNVVMSERVSHVLVNFVMGGVENVPLWRFEVARQPWQIEKYLLVTPFLDCEQTLIISAAGNAFLRSREDLRRGVLQFQFSTCLSPAGVAQGSILSHERKNDRAEVTLMPRNRSCRRTNNESPNADNIFLDFLTELKIYSLSFSSIYEHNDFDITGCSIMQDASHIRIL